MFRSKREVDAHVRDLFSKVANETDKIQKCLTVAKQYAAIKDFDSAKRYLETYLESPSSTNPAEAHKLLGDIQLELNEEEKALGSYKSAYEIGKGRDALNRVCDLLSQGCGAGDSVETRTSWMDLQKSSSSGGMDITPKNQNGIGKGQYSTSTFVTRGFTPSSGGGPPKSGMNGSLISVNNSPKLRNNSSTPIKSNPQGSIPSSDYYHTPKQRGMGSSRFQASPERLFMQMAFLEKRYDDVIERIVDQHNQVMNEMQLLKEEILTDQNAHGVNEVANVKEELSQQNTQVINQMQSLKEEVLGNIKSVQERVEKISISQQKISSTQEQILTRLNEEKSAEFKTKMQEMIDLVASSVSSSQSTNQIAEEEPSWETVQPATAEAPKPLSEMFKKQAGSWDCTTCYVNNTCSAIKCISCETPQPGHEAEVAAEKEKKDKEIASQIPAFSFGFLPTTTTESFAPVSKPSIFGTEAVPFSFNLPSFKLPDSQSETTTTPNLFSNLSFASPGFGELAKGSPVGALSKPADFKGFGGEGKTLFGDVGSINATPTTTSTTTPRNRTASEGDDDFVPTAEFAPVIPLPPLVEVKLGDENENVMFEHRAKIYRFDAEKKEWKERGVGNIKILQHKDDISQVRVLMWRERVLKLACNHRITGDMKIENFQNNPKVLKWSAVDHSEDGASPEIFTCRFGTEEKCAEFKTKMQEMIDIVASSVPSTNQVAEEKSSRETVQPATTEAPKPLSEMFKKQAGSWDCTTCYVNNTSSAIKCISCETPQPGHEAEVAAEKEKKDKEIASQIPAFSFGFLPTATSEASAPVSKPSVFGADAAPFSFNLPSFKLPDSQSETTTTPNLFSNLSFASPGFGELAKGSPVGAFSKPADFKGFGGEGKSLFGDVGSNNTTSTTSTTTPRNRTASEGDDDFVPTAEFAPVIPLPPLVEVKLGDENENVMFEHRAKIYRFDAEKKEWKERGVGNIKILQHKDDISQVRVLMWRERVLKLACNHRITGDMKIENFQNNPKVLKWSAVDHSEDGASPEIFTCRFGTEEKCAEFKTKMQEMIDIVASSVPSTNQVAEEKPSWETVQPATTEAPKPLSEMFKKQAGSWDCTTCYVNNTSSAIKCISCETPQPGHEAEVAAEKGKKDKEIASQIPAFSFGFLPTATSEASAPVSKPSVFGADAAPFSFNLPSFKLPDSQSETTTTPNLFSNLSFASPGFGELAKGSPVGAFSKPADFKGFGGEGKALFGDAGSNNNTTTRNRTASEGDDDFVPTAEFAPVIPLPPLVEVKLGDENENVMFEHRAKIYRFDAEKKEWKERGVGNIKILQHKDDISQVRVLMWRERVLKLACNHRITGDMKIENFQNNPKVLKWSAVDHSEDGASPEIFTCRFGTEEKCAEFKTKMQEMIDIVASSVSSNQSTNQIAEEEPSWETVQPATTEAPKPLSEMFKKQAGSWDCTTCYVNNASSAIKCISCETPQPGHEAEVAAEKEKKDKEIASQIPAFSFGFKTPPTAAVVPASNFSFTVPSSGFDFGTTSSSTAAVEVPLDSSDLKELAAQFQLPEDFYDNESECFNCVGCRGCDPEGYEFYSTEDKLAEVDPKTFEEILSKRSDSDVIDAAWSD